MTNDHFECYREIIPEFAGFQESLKRPLPVHLRGNRLKIEPGRLSQALTSCLVPIALCPRSGSYVLDMCASPGGKTSQLAQLMNNTGIIVANELYPNRHIPLAHTLARLGVLNAVLTAYQAQEFPLKHCFDYILADVPCSGEGRFRVVKKLSRYRAGKGREKLPQLQKKIILRGYDLLKDEGEMIYATCTYNPEENESVVDFLLKNREAELLLIDSGFRAFCHQGKTRYLRRKTEQPSSARRGVLKLVD